jgi:hypothetical protein
LKRIACITLDVEPDYGQDHISSRYLVDEFLSSDNSRLNSVLKLSGVKLTAFVVGAILESRPSIVDSLAEINAEIELHSYGHSMKRERESDVSKGVEVFRDVIGKRPMGYRAPQGVISGEEIRVLNGYDVRFDSSVFPFFRPGKFSNLHVPREPYFIESSSMIEFPIASIPVLRLPISLSYIMLLGWDTYRLLLRLFGMPRTLVFDFHLHDLIPSQSFTQLSTTWQYVYSVIYRRNPWRVFREFISLLRNEGYTLLHMKDLYRLTIAERSQLPPL